MNSTMLWVLFPLAVGIGLVFLRREGLVPLLVAALVSLFLAGATWFLPIDEAMQLGPFSVEILPTFILAGRSFTLTADHAPLLGLVYLMQTLWILGSYLAKPSRLFVPLSLVSVSLLVAALAVQPFLYAALLIAMAAILQIPVLLPGQVQPGSGIRRFLEVQVMAVPLILFAGWVLSGVEANPGNSELILRAGLLLVVGFALLLALFPFHSWMPMLAAETHPYSFAFLIVILTSFELVFGMGFFDRYAWLRETDFVRPLLLILGGLMVALAGLWAARETNPRRTLAYGAMLSVGFGVQSLGLAGGAGTQILFALLLPQAFTLWVWAAALGRLTQFGSTNSLEDIRSLLAGHPLTTAVLLASMFSLSGLPLLASFSGRLAVLDSAATYSPWSAALALLGSLGLLGAAVRTLAATLPGEARPAWRWVEEAETPATRLGGGFGDIFTWIFAAISLGGMLGFGLLPRFFLVAVPKLAAIFGQLFP